MTQNTKCAHAVAVGVSTKSRATCSDRKCQLRADPFELLAELVAFVDDDLIERRPREPGGEYEFAAVKYGVPATLDAWLAHDRRLWTETLRKEASEPPTPV